MAGKRERIAQLLDRTRVTDVLLALRARTPPAWLTILTYHRVGTPSADDPLPDETFDASDGLFAEQIRFLSERFNFVSTDEVVEFLHGRSLPPNPAMITFDDGYRECLTGALPILQDYGARATFFIATDYIEQRKLFWWDRIGLLVSRATNDPIVLDYPMPMRLPKAEAYKTLNGLVKSEVGLDLGRLMDHLEERSGASISSEEEQAMVDALIMTWDEIHQLSDAGMDIQSHTRSHRVLQTLLPEQLADELAGSRAVLEERMGLPVKTVAYPVGYRVNDAPSITRALDEAGYEAGYTNQTGPVPTWGSIDRFDVNRIAMSEIYQDAFFRSVMAFPPLAFG
jgi:peptidoglycan/xylan/chitin deacetylase (PgdA/CDA1 family)